MGLAAKYGGSANGYHSLQVSAAAGQYSSRTLGLSSLNAEDGVREEQQHPAEYHQEKQALCRRRVVVAAWSMLGLLVLASATTAILLAAGKETGLASGGAGVVSGANQTTNKVRPQPDLVAGVDYSALLKPAFHITSEPGPNGTWINDPNGMFQLNGLTHVFYQLNPFGAQWSTPYWGHVVSRDLAHWRRLPRALEPDQWYDRDGVFSGSATVVKGVPIMLYTGVMNYSQYGFYYQLQALALPAVGNDPYYVHWEKPALDNPLSLAPPPGGSNAQFRDPVTAWRAEYGLQDPIAKPGSPPPPPGGNSSDGIGLWYTAIGVLDDCIGGAALYSSPDLRSWTYYGTLFSQLAQNFSVYQQCLDPNPAGDIPPGTKGFGGTCDQFGADCHMWECPDFYRVAPGVLAVKYSDQVRDRSVFGGDWYVLGSGPLNYSNAPAQDGYDAFNGRMGQEAYAPRLIDYGAVYASKTFALEDGRRVWLGWVYEDSLGCEGMCGDGTDFIFKLGWQGAQTLPRLVTYDVATQRLLFSPLPELQQLRLSVLYDDAFILDPISSANGSAVESATTAGAMNVLFGGREVTLDDGGSAALLAALGASGCSGNGTLGVRPWLESEGVTFLAYSELVPEQKVVAATEVASSNGSTCTLDPVVSGALGPQPCAGGHRRQLEVFGNFSLLPPVHGSFDAAGMQMPFSFAVGYELVTGNATSTAIYLNGTATPAIGRTGVAQVTALDLFIDKSRSGGMTSPCTQGGPVDLPHGGVPASQLTLHVYVDRSVIEAFALGGRGRVTSRIYPLTHNVAWGLRAFGAVGGGGMVEAGAPLVAVEAQVYDLDSCWRDEI